MLPPSSPAGSLAPALPANPSRRGGPRPGAPAARRGVRVGGRGRLGVGAGPGEGWERGRRGREERVPGGRGRRAAAERRASTSAPSSGTPPPAAAPPPARGQRWDTARRWPGGGGGGGGGEGCPALGEAGGGGRRADDRREGERALRKSPENREDGGGRCGRGGGGPSPPSRGVTLARPPAAPGCGEGGRNASPQALISPPNPVPGTRGQRRAGRGPGFGFGEAQARVRGRDQTLPPGPGLVPARGIRTRSGREQSGFRSAPGLVPGTGTTCVRPQPELRRGPWSHPDPPLPARRPRLGGGRSGCPRELKPSTRINCLFLKLIPDSCS